MDLRLEDLLADHAQGVGHPPALARGAGKLLVALGRLLPWQPLDHIVVDLLHEPVDRTVRRVQVAFDQEARGQPLAHGFLPGFALRLGNAPGRVVVRPLHAMAQLANRERVALEVETPDGRGGRRLVLAIELQDLLEDPFLEDGTVDDAPRPPRDGEGEEPVSPPTTAIELVVHVAEAQLEDTLLEDRD